MLLQDKEVILNNVCKLVPSLKHAKSVRDWVGLRPYREPVRLQLDHHEVRQPYPIAKRCQLSLLQQKYFCNEDKLCSFECTLLKLSWH